LVGQSPVIYPYVIKYRVDSTGSINTGKSVYRTQITYDDPDPSAYFDPKDEEISYWWMNNLPAEESDYGYRNNIYYLINDKVYHYSGARTTYKKGIVMHHNYATIPSYIWPYVITENAAGMTLPEYFISEYLMPTGFMELDSVRNISYDTLGNALSSVMNYSYKDTAYLLPTSKQTFSSKGDTLLTNLMYPNDMVDSAAVYSEMVNRNIKSDLIIQKYLDNSVQENWIKSGYSDFFGTGALLVQDSIQEQIGSNPIETRIYMSFYDQYGNILQQQKSSDMILSYIWDYNSLAPIASAQNAIQSDIAYTSFEAEGSGNWTIPDTTRIRTVAITGNMAYHLNGSNSITKSGLNPALTYVIGYWQDSANTVSITSGYGGARMTIGTWTYYEDTVHGVTSVTVSGTGTIDELRLFPKGALMTNFTYSPLIGMTSQSDPSGKLVYYMYDGLGRLKLIKDQYGNILKRYDYEYQTGNH
jgi:hypothetical protein